MIVTEIRRQGTFLFRHRSGIPLLIVIPVAVALIRLTPLTPLPYSHEWWQLACFAISLAGLLVRVLTVGFVPGGTSGRNTLRQRAHELNTTGLYSIVRHPLYLGNFLIWLGVVLNVGDYAIVGMFVFAFWVYYERIMSAEEAFLETRFGSQWKTWAEKTPAFLPRFSAWRRPGLPFSVRTVLRREYCGLFGLTSAFTAIEVCRHALAEHRLFAHPVWIVTFAVGTTTFVVLRALKKLTRLLHVSGR